MKYMKFIIIGLIGMMVMDSKGRPGNSAWSWVDFVQVDNQLPRGNSLLITIPSNAPQIIKSGEKSKQVSMASILDTGEIKISLLQANGKASLSDYIDIDTTRGDQKYGRLTSICRDPAGNGKQMICAIHFVDQH